MRKNLLKEFSPHGGVRAAIGLLLISTIPLSSPAMAGGSSHKISVKFTKVADLVCNGCCNR
jgi:hypothetical protein